MRVLNARLHPEGLGEILTGLNSPMDVVGPKSAAFKPWCVGRSGWVLKRWRQNLESAPGLAYSRGLSLGSELS